jgi:hypothetical protein
MFNAPSRHSSTFFPDAFVARIVRSRLTGIPSRFGGEKLDCDGVVRDSQRFV